MQRAGPGSARPHAADGRNLAPRAYVRRGSRHECSTPVAGGVARRRLRALSHVVPLQMPTPRAPQEDRRKDFERRAVIDVALTLAELDASWGDYGYAIEHLDAANRLSGGSIARRWGAQRRRWKYAARGYED